MRVDMATFVLSFSRHLACTVSFGSIHAGVIFVPILDGVWKRAYVGIMGRTQEAFLHIFGSY